MTRGILCLRQHGKGLTMADTPIKAPGDSPLSVKSGISAPGKPAAAEAKPDMAEDKAERVAQALRTITPATTPRTDSRHNPLLDQLVYGDNDLVGLVAYALHEVNRRDWRNAYEQAHGRPPSEAEFNAYLVGEQLERRLDTYRRLAEDAIAKVATGDSNLRRLAEGVPDLPRLLPAHEVKATPATGRALSATSADKAVVPPKKSGDVVKLVIYLGFLLIAVAILAYLLRHGMDAGSTR